MSASLNNVTTTDAYTAATTLSCEGAVRINLTVANAAIYYKFSGAADDMKPQGNPFNQETFLPPGYYNFTRRTHAVAVRSGRKGRPAQVTIEALDSRDIA